MPNYYAHLVFGREVFSRLSGSFRRRIGRELAAFQAGLLGPDPLFFYHPLGRSQPWAAGVGIHREPVRPAADRLMALVREGRPWAEGYAAGFLCHFALDSCCHSYVERREAEGGPTHRRMEAELDRALMLRDGVDPFHRTPFPRLRLSAPFYETAAAVYPGVTARQYAAALRQFRRVCRVQTLLSGTVGRGLTEGVPLTRGTVLSTWPDPDCRVASAVLVRILEQEVLPAAGEIQRFFRVAREGGELGKWYDRSFDAEV